MSYDDYNSPVCFLQINRQHACYVSIISSPFVVTLNCVHDLLARVVDFSYI